VPDPSTPISPAATRGRAPSRLYGPCGHGTGPCGATPTRPYPNGARCAAHTPAALAGQPEPGATAYCPPARCLCGHCESWRPYNAYAANADSWVTDARNIASGKKRASPQQQAAAKAAVAEQKAREAALRKGAA
jgi:hypothetical protein